MEGPEKSTQKPTEEKPTQKSTEIELKACNENGYFFSNRFTKTCFDDAVLLALAKFPLQSLKDELQSNINNKFYNEDSQTIPLYIDFILSIYAGDISEIFRTSVASKTSDLNKIENITIINELNAETATQSYYNLLAKNNIVKSHNNIIDRIGKYIDDLRAFLKLKTLSYQDFYKQESKWEINDDNKIIACYYERVTYKNNDIPEKEEYNEWKKDNITQSNVIRNKFHIFSIIALNDKLTGFSVYVLNPCVNKWIIWDVTNNIIDKSCKEGKSVDKTTDKLLEHVADKGLIYLYTTQENINAAKEMSIKVPTSQQIDKSQPDKSQPDKSQPQQLQQPPPKEPEKKSEQTQSTQSILSSASSSIPSSAPSTVSLSSSIPPSTSFSAPSSTPSSTPSSAPSSISSSTLFSNPEKYVPMDTKARIEEIKQNMPFDHHLNSSVASLRFVEGTPLQCVIPITRQLSIDYGTFKTMGNLCKLQGIDSLKKDPIGTLVVLSDTSKPNESKPNESKLKESKITTIYMKIDTNTYITLNNYYGINPAGESTLYVDGIGKFTVKGIVFKQ